ncbi:MAG: nucleoside 2-deoxyribosyltransferase [Patescibacteria group bacterium]
MKIYFAGAIYGGREKLKTYIKIQKFLESLGHEFLTKHVTGVGMATEETEFRKTPRESFARNLSLMAQADCLIAEITLPSLGVGYEIAYALHTRKIPVLALFEKDKKHQVSAMMRGNTLPNYQILGYEEGELKATIKNFLSKLRNFKFQIPISK